MALSIYDRGIAYDVRFFNDYIRTLVTNTPHVVDRWITRIERDHRSRLHRLIVGFDVEWRPAFNANFRNPVATLQLCVGRRCLIFQIIRAPFISQLLSNFLRNPNYTFVGVGIQSNVEKLRIDYNLEVARATDLRTLAAEAYNVRTLRNAGLKGLTRRVLQKEFNKPVEITMSGWDNEWLSRGQVMYGCVDAFLSFEIGRILISGY